MTKERKGNVDMAGEFDDSVEAAAAREHLEFADGYLLDGGDRLFHCGNIRDGAELRSMLYAWRQGRTTGKKEGRADLQYQLRSLLEISNA